MHKPKLLDRVRAVARVRHLSIRTEQAYTDWIRRFILFHQKHHPAEMCEEGAARSVLLRLLPPPDAERSAQAPDPELKRMLDDMRRRLPANGGRRGFDAAGKDAA